MLICCNWYVAKCYLNFINNIENNSKIAKIACYYANYISKLATRDPNIFVLFSCYLYKIASAIFVAISCYFKIALNSANK